MAREIRQTFAGWVFSWLTPLRLAQDLVGQEIARLSSIDRKIPAKSIRVWGCVGALDAEFDALLDSLSPEEQKRANAYRFPDDRRRFVCAHHFLRRVLAHHLECSPSEIRYRWNQWGKPAVDAPAGHALHFNLSHSGGIVLLAVSTAGEVGVDVERLRDVLADEAIVRRQFSPPERAYVQRASDSLAAFFEIWTGKEAYIKAIGRGLAHPLTQFSVSPNCAPTSVHDWSDYDGENDWMVRILSLPNSDYTASLATIGDCPAELIIVSDAELRSEL